jgi:dephospho-CoA kinase
MENLNPTAEHFVIGLTGNIGSGKSLVRQMLEHLGALGIDADWLTREAARKGNPGYTAILKHFGNAILDGNGEINRRQLGRQVFSSRQALEELENILHPLASAATRRIIAHSPLPVVVIEAIKVLESDMAEQCQQIWVVATDEDSLYERLQRTRGMSPTDIRARLAQQTPTAQMKERAHVVIENSGSITAAWAQVQAAWHKLPKQDWDATPFADAQRQAQLLNADEAGLAQVGAFLQANPDSIPARFLESVRSDKQKPDSAQDLLLRDMLRYYFSAAREDELAVWCREGFASQIYGYHFAQDHSGAKLKSLLLGIENLNAYYLCRQMSLPVRPQDASMLAGLGYDIRNDPNDLPELTRKAGYNQYNKSLADVLTLF